MIRGDIDLTENLDFYHDRKSIESKIKNKAKAEIVPWDNCEKKVLNRNEYRYLAYNCSYYNSNTWNFTTSYPSYTFSTYDSVYMQWYNNTISVQPSYIQIEPYDYYIVYDDYYFNSDFYVKTIDADNSEHGNGIIPWADKKSIKPYRYFKSKDDALCCLKANKKNKCNEDNARLDIENDIRLHTKSKIERSHIRAIFDIFKNPKNIYDDNKRDTYGKYWRYRFELGSYYIRSLQSGNRNRRYKRSKSNRRLAPWLEKLSTQVYDDYIKDLENEQDYTSYLTDMGWLRMN